MVSLRVRFFYHKLLTIIGQKTFLYRSTATSQSQNSCTVAVYCG